MSDPLLDGLNPPQREAVTATEGPLLIIAGAGSGKTRVITYRIAYLIHECGVAPGQIFASTFTNKAAAEMRERVRRLLGSDKAMPFAVSTFHSWCARALRREAAKVGIAPDFSICDEDDQLSILKEVFRGLGLDPKSGKIQPSQAQWTIEQAKMRLQGPDDVRQMKGDPERAAMYADVFAAYQRMLRQNSALDFGDLLAEVVRLLENDRETLEAYQDRYRYLMVDEYQDTNHVQFRLVAALASKYRSICVVGDEDQSIYSWRGADLGNLLDFQKHFPEAKMIRLEQNYRSTQNILTAASEVIANNRLRLGKTLWTDRGNGSPILLFEGESDRDEADQVLRLIKFFHDTCHVPYREIAVFYRTNALSRIYEERLRSVNIAYRVVGSLRFFDRREIKDLLAYLRAAANPHDSLALSRIINTPRRGIGETTVEQIVARMMKENLTLYQAIEAMRASGELTSRADRKITEFLALLKSWSERARSLSIADLLGAILKETGYVESLGDPNLLDVISRRENIDELRNVVAQFQNEFPTATLSDFLEYTSLRTSVDDYDAEEDCVSLMTIHCAKGLEFQVVFLVALEKGIFPHFLSVKDKDGIEEERRLFYVGVTRAKDVVCLSYAASRFMHGESRWNTPSQFLGEVPRELQHWPDRETLAEVRAQLGTAPVGQVGRAGQVGQVRPAGPVGRVRQARQDTEAPDKAPRAQWRQGQVIVHPTLGRGTVVAIRGSGRGETMTVEFDNGQRMEFRTRFARLKHF